MYKTAMMKPNFFGKKRDDETISNEEYKFKWEKKEIFEFLSEVVSVINDENNNFDALLFGWSGHGEANDVLISSDETAEESKILLSSVIKYFNDNNCPKLRRKVRIFFVDACRVIFKIN